jgi:4-alpha-glucanotransferase
MKRSCGILLSVSSLPSSCGIGTFGEEAYRFVDFLARARQQYWQVLPLGPTGFADSPYQSFSAFAGNPYFIDLETLARDGLLDADEFAWLDWGGSPREVDYGKMFGCRYTVLRRAYEHAKTDGARLAELDAFCKDNAFWLDNYALFMALKDAHGGAAWILWEEPLRARDTALLDEQRGRLKNDIRFHCFLQWQFFVQWRALKKYANEKGVHIIGDLPIYVPMDSADVWAAPEEFQLDSERRPRYVAGVPPDYFTADGQLWGNPLYDWVHMKQTGYAWWKRRMHAACSLYDVIRIDHFRGLCSYWRIPADETTARVGEWVNGPGIEFVDMLKSTFPDTAFIAEDLGYLDDDVRALVDKSGFPGMKVLQFAFDAREPGNYLPHTYPRNCVCYTGTHDNTTAAGWFSEALPEDVQMAHRYLGLNTEEGYHWGLIRGGMASVADLFVAEMQDYFGLDSTARMNIPGTIGGRNWRWRMLPGEAGGELADRIAAMTRLYGRA